MSEPNVNLSNLFAELKKIEQNGEFEKGIKVSNKSNFFNVILQENFN